MHLDADGFERARYVIAGAHDVADVEAWGDLYVHAGRAIGSGGIEIVGTQAQVAGGDESGLELLAIEIGNGGDGVGLFGKLRRRDAEGNVLFLALAAERKGRLGGVRMPAPRQIKMHCAFRRTLYLALHRDRYRESLFA